MRPRTFMTDAWPRPWRALIVDDAGREMKFPHEHHPYRTSHCFTEGGARRQAERKIARVMRGRTW